MRVVYDHDGDKAVINVMNLPPPPPSFHEQRRGVSGMFAFPGAQANGEDLETVPKIRSVIPRHARPSRENSIAMTLFGKKSQEKSNEELK